jgi:hypothetical protein
VELLLGCGSNRAKKLVWQGRSTWSGLVTLDFDESHKPDVVHDLRKLPLPFEDNSADEIHAFEVLEHTGQQGDFEFFFAQWSDFWRVLKPGGVFLGTSPDSTSRWAWGDPGHTRIISAECLAFLSQPNYAQVGKSPMTDYRSIYKADFDLIHSHVDETQTYQYCLQAIKPARA